ncbi:MAG: hypothetical protein U5K69_04655 [Balneolaceae bacterium]|nr:hypothetical protein [Balneolaceae bacterium]
MRSAAIFFIWEHSPRFCALLGSGEALLPTTLLGQNKSGVALIGSE